MSVVAGEDHAGSLSSTAEKNKEKLKKIEKKTAFKWAESILGRVNEGDKVPFSDLERAHGIIRGMIGGEDADQPTTRKPRWVKNITELAAEMGVTRRTISNWRKRPEAPKPASDGRWNIVEWQIWAGEEGVGHTATDDESEAVRNEYMLENWRLRNERLRIDLEQVRGSMSDNEDVARMVRRMITNCRRVLTSIAGTLAPQLAGMPTPEIEKRIREEVESAMRQLSEGEWL